jgi:hypothetical protein
VKHYYCIPFLANLCLALFVAGIPGMATGQTLLPSEIHQDTVLTRENSPYLLQDDLTIQQGVILQVEAGVTITFTSFATITVYGSLVAEGTRGDSIYFIAQNEASPWQQINSDNATLIFRYCKISGSRRFINAEGGNLIRVDHSSIVSSATGNGEDCIAVHDAKRVEIDSSQLLGMGGTIAQGSKNDAIDLDHVDSCFVRRNSIVHFSDDGIDIGTEGVYALISGNFISYCNYGISAGEYSVVFADHNIITHSDGGFQVHNHAVLYCNYTTLYLNRWGIECYHSEEGSIQTGGRAQLLNTIFSATIDDEILTQTSSEIAVSYSLSDREILPGEQNLMDDPRFRDPENSDFSLMDDSPCILTGTQDGMGNRTTMGAVPYLSNETGLLPFLDQDVKVYPNPAADLICIELTGEEKPWSIALFNDQGSLLYKQTSEQTSVFVNLESYPYGIYLLQLSFPGSIRTMRIVKR